jgi:hypothetical protein
MAMAKHHGSPKYTALQVDGIFPPPMWEYSKMPWFLGLAVKIFRRDPQLAPNVADILGDIENLPVSRAQLKRRKQVEVHHANAAQKRQKENPPATAGGEGFSTPSVGNYNPRFGHDVDGSVRPVASVASVLTTATNAAIEKKILWAKVLTSKSIAENTNIAKRMGKMEELEKGMTLLDKMRNSIREDAYHVQVQDVLKAFPTFNTYHAEVDVIEIIDDPVDADSVSVTEPDLSKMRVAGISIPPKIIWSNLPPDVDVDIDDKANTDE